LSNREENLVSEAVKRRGLHLESEEKLLEKCGIVGGVASKVRSVRRRYLKFSDCRSCFRSEE